MPPAARVGDATAHGIPLMGTGSGNVIVGGRPAWRAGADVTHCPLMTAQVPHGPEVAPMGSTSVLINGRPAARMGDSLVGTASPNTIVSGDPTVLIG